MTLPRGLLLLIAASFLFSGSAKASDPIPTRSEAAQLKAIAAAGSKLSRAVVSKRSALKSLSVELTKEYVVCADLTDSLSKASRTAPLVASLAWLDLGQEVQAILGRQYQTYSTSFSRAAKAARYKKAAWFQSARLETHRLLPDFSFCQMLDNWDRAEPYSFAPEGFQTVVRELNPTRSDWVKANKSRYLAGDQAHFKMWFEMAGIETAREPLRVFGNPYTAAERLVTGGRKLRALR